MSRSSPIIEFANILRSTGVGSDEAEQFKKAHGTDQVFLERAGVLEKLFASQGRVLSALRSQSQPTAVKFAPPAAGRATEQARARA
jgi:hypothetical protein